MNLPKQKLKKSYKEISTDNKTVDILDKLTPQCGFINLMSCIGCLADIYFTYHFEWEAWEFGMVFTGILVPAKAAKIADARWGGKGK